MRLACKAWHTAARLTALSSGRPLVLALEEPEALLQDISESVAHLCVTVPAGELEEGGSASLAEVQERLEGQLREHWLSLNTVTWQVLDVDDAQLTWVVSQGLAFWNPEQPEGFCPLRLPSCPNMPLASPMVLDCVVLTERSLFVRVGGLFTAEFEGLLTWCQLIAGVFAAGNKPASAMLQDAYSNETGQPWQGTQPMRAWDHNYICGFDTMWFRHACRWTPGQRLGRRWRSEGARGLACTSSGIECARALTAAALPCECARLQGTRTGAGRGEGRAKEETQAQRWGCHRTRGLASFCVRGWHVESM
ncbi:hypothetical protein FOA52_014248 [Chlamydomonas sp. UWO 241]|nr:hypothetical protein FOA52_014248 [Chlamydomonas sp. UWO 241]